jgi:predicted ATPase
MTHPDGERIAPLFLSYAAVDRQRALAIANALQTAGISVWIDREGITGGASYSLEIATAIRTAPVFLLCVTPASLASRNVRQEIALAWKHEKPIMPLLLEPTAIPDALEYWLEATQWIEVLDRATDDWLPEVLRALRANGLSIDGPPEPVVPGSAFIPESHLPLLPLSVIGRDDDIARIANLLRTGTRLLTLTGPGGIGKSTLAVATAQTLLADYPDGAWFIDLAPALTQETAIAAIAQGIGVRELAGQTSVPDLLATLRAKRTLLIFDNAEHLEGIGEIIGRLVAGAPNLTALVTSRRPLHLRAEREHPVQALSTPDAMHDLVAIAASPAVQLFVERARQTVPSFALDASNAQHVVAICARLDGLPLALELAAARVRLFAPAQLLDRLDRSLSVLSGGSADTPRRQRTLAETVLWSVNLLSPEEQALFRRLAVFAGAFSFDAAETVAGEPIDARARPIDLVRALDALVDNNLIVRTESPEGDIQFRMLVTIHDIARDLLDASAEDDHIRDRHAEWCVELSNTLRTEWFLGFEGMHSLRLELPDFRAALAWLEQIGASVEYKTIAGNMAFIWNTVFNQEAQRIFRQAPGRDDPADPVVHASFLAGWLTADKEWFVQHDDLDARFAELQDLCERIGDRFGAAYAAHEWSSVCVSRKEWDAAAQSLARARSMWQAMSLPRWDGMSAIAEGAVAFYRGDFEIAGRLLRKTLETTRAEGSVVLTASCETWISLLETAFGRLSAGAAHALSALRSLQAYGMGTILAGWAGAAAWIVRVADPANARMVGQALRVQQATGYNYNMVAADLTLLPNAPQPGSADDVQQAMSLESLVEALKAQLLQLAEPELLEDRGLDLAT